MLGIQRIHEGHVIPYGVSIVADFLSGKGHSVAIRVRVPWSTATRWVSNIAERLEGYFVCHKEFILIVDKTALLLIQNSVRWHTALVIEKTDSQLRR